MMSDVVSSNQESTMKLDDGSKHAVKFSPPTSTVSSNGEPSYTVCTTDGTVLDVPTTGTTVNVTVGRSCCKAKN